MAHFATGEQFLHAEFEVAFDGDGGAHGDHGAGLDGQRAAHGELQGEEGVGVAVRDAVGAAVESACVVDGGLGAGEVSWGWGAAGHGAGAVEGGLAGARDGLLLLLVMGL